MKKWQIEKLEILDILEVLFRFFSCPTFRFCPIAETENLDLKNVEKKFRGFRDFQGFRIFDLA